MKHGFLLFVLLFMGSAYAQNTGVRVVGVDARLEDNNLIVEVLAINPEAKEHTISITTTYFGKTDTRKTMLPPDSTKKVTYTLHNVTAGTITMAITAGSSKFVEITIPPDTANQALYVREITQEDAFINEYSTNNNTLRSLLMNPYIIGSGIAVLVAIALLLRVLVFRSKTQVQLDRNEQLLKAAEEAKKERRSHIEKIEV